MQTVDRKPLTVGRKSEETKVATSVARIEHTTLSNAAFDLRAIRDAQRHDAG